jgi:hypothetical protein
MKALHALRLLLDVLGALFLGMIAIAPLVYGVLPYEGLKRLGTIPFYGLLGAAVVLWAWLVARSSPADPRQTPRTPAAGD